MNKNRLFISMLWRSFFIQAIWNFERLQNIGFVYGLLPFFRYLYPDPGERREVLLRHIGFFNTHPYMVSMIFGMVSSLEEDLRNGKPVNKDQLVTLKNNIAGPLAAIGDTFFWATWRPFTVLIAVSLILFFHGYDNVYGTWLAPIAFLAVYNAIHIPFRYWSLKISYQLRTRVVEIIADMEFQYAVDMVRLAGLVVLIVVIVYYFWAFGGTGLAERAQYLLLFLLAVAAGSVRVPALALFYGTVVLSILFIMIRGYW